MTRIHLLFLLLLCAIPSTILAQENRDAMSERNRNVIAPNSNVFRDRGQGLTVNKMSVQEIAHSQPSSIVQELPMPSGSVLTLNMTRMSVANMLDVVSYKAESENGDIVVLTFSTNGSMLGAIIGEPNSYVITKDLRSADPNAYVIKLDKMHPIECKTRELENSRTRDIESLISKLNLNAWYLDNPNLLALDTLEIKLAIEADKKLFKLLESKEAVSLYVVQLVSMVSAIYERDVAIRFTISHVNVWTSDSPYPQNQNVFSVLDDFITIFARDNPSIDRDIAVYITSDYGDQGISALIGGLCTDSGSYCAVDLHGTLAPDAEGLLADVFVTAHEIGHICGSMHTQSCIWPGGPIDSCSQSEFGECVPWYYRIPTRGTIMSYCHQLLDNGATIAYEFHPLCRNVIRGVVQSSSCIVNAPPPASCTVYGTVTNANTGEPIPNLKLTLGRFPHGAFRTAPVMTTDTVVVTGSDGRYVFNGLDYYIYYIQTDSGWVPSKMDVNTSIFTNVIQISSQSTQYDIALVRGLRIETRMSYDSSDFYPTLNFFSESLRRRLEVQYSSTTQIQENDSTLLCISYLPNGSYTIVPSCYGTTISPNQLRFVVDANEPLNQIEFTVHKSNALSSVACGLIDMGDIPVTKLGHFVGGRPFQLLRDSDSAIVATGVFDAYGVAVVDSVPEGEYYTFYPVVDTTEKAPYWNGQVAPGWDYSAVLSKQQNRRFPLIARAYSMSVVQSQYQPLVSPRVLLSRTNDWDSGYAVAIPFNLNILGRQLDTFYVLPDGHVLFLPGYTGIFYDIPFDIATETRFAVSVFTGRNSFDEFNPDDWSISYQAQGVEPNRRVVVQWKDLRVGGWDSLDHYVESGPFSFQLIIHENTDIDMVYETPDSVQAPFEGFIGLRGNDIYDNQMVVSNTTPRNATASYQFEERPTLRITTPTDIPSGLTYHWSMRPTDVEPEHTPQTNNHAPTFSIYPTVATTTLTLQHLTTQSTATIYNTLGVVVLTTDVSPSNATINIAHLASGRYTIVMSGGDVGAVGFVVVR